MMAIFAALALPAVLVLGIYTATAMEELRTKLARQVNLPSACSRHLYKHR